jgi:hypothetical protein
MNLSNLAWNSNTLRIRSPSFAVIGHRIIRIIFQLHKDEQTDNHQASPTLSSFAMNCYNWVIVFTLIMRDSVVYLETLEKQVGINAKF